MIPAQPSRTALRVALRRAAHQVVDHEPLVFRDPFATRIIGPEAAAELQRTPSPERKPYSAAMRSWMVARARFAEDVLAETVAQQTTESRCTGSSSTQNAGSPDLSCIPSGLCEKTRGGGPSLQYLVLGAGLDTFALRNPYPHVHVFEVDHPATQAWKRERLQAAALTLPANATLVPVDFEQQSLRQQLLHAGFRLDRPTVTAWLGVVPYLTPDAFAATCRVLGRFAPGSAVVFDYSQPREVLPPVEQLMHDSLAARVAQAGEPFQLFFTPQSLAAELEVHNLAVAEDLGSPELTARYFAQRTDGLGLRGTAGRLCHAVLTQRDSTG